jgi:predicted nucleic acid-binding protein
MRIVLDLNTLVSGLLWQSTPRRLLDLARSGRFDLLSSAL